MLAFAVNGCFGSIVAWQDAGCQPPPEEMGRHHLAGHPRGEGVVVTRQIQKDSP